MPLFPQLYNFAHWLTQDRAEAEDLVQETFAKALNGFSSFQAGTNFRAWMYRILRNTFLNLADRIEGLRLRYLWMRRRTKGPNWLWRETLPKAS